MVVESVCHAGRYTSASGAASVYIAALSVVAMTLQRWVSEAGSQYSDGSALIPISLAFETNDECVVPRRRTSNGCETPV